MPDLTIKPNVGNGNKVIIQDQSETAVFTTADSGVTIANASLTTPPHLSFIPALSNLESNSTVGKISLSQELSSISVE